jgi:hypothetical protein
MIPLFIGLSVGLIAGYQIRKRRNRVSHIYNDTQYEVELYVQGDEFIAIKKVGKSKEQMKGCLHPHAELTAEKNGKGRTQYFCAKCGEIMKLPKVAK